MKKLIALVLVLVAVVAVSVPVIAAPIEKGKPALAQLVWDDPDCPYVGDIRPMGSTTQSPDIFPYVPRCTGTAWADRRLDPHSARIASEAVIDAKCLTLEEWLGEGVAISDVVYKKWATLFKLVKVNLPGGDHAYKVTCAPAQEGPIGIPPMPPKPAR